MAVGALLFLATSVLIGLVTVPWQFILYFGILMSAALAIFQVPLVTAVTMWFSQAPGRRHGTLAVRPGPGQRVVCAAHGRAADPTGLALGVLGTRHCGGAAPVRADPLLPQRAGRDRAAAPGCRSAGTRSSPCREVRCARVRTTVFLQQARRTFAFWNLIGIHYWGCAGHAIIMVYLADIVRAQGLSLATGALVVSTMFGVSSFTRFAVPILADRVGSKRAMALCFFLQGLPILLLFWAHEAWHFYLFAVLFGIGFGGEMSAFPIINRQYYGNAPTGTVYGWQMLGSGIGMASGSFLGGVLRDLTGDLHPGARLSPSSSA